MRRGVMLQTTAQVMGLIERSSVKDAKLPKPGERLMICYPTTLTPYEVDLVEIQWTNRKSSSSNEKLWAVTSSSALGRAFDESVQESHVIRYVAHHFELHRQRKLAEFAAEEAKAAREMNLAFH